MASFDGRVGTLGVRCLPNLLLYLAPGSRRDVCLACAAVRATAFEARRVLHAFACIGRVTAPASVWARLLCAQVE